MRRILDASVLACLLTMGLLATGVRAQEDPQEAPPAAAESQSEKPPAQRIAELIQQGQLDEAAQQMEDAELRGLEIMQLRSQLAMGYARAENYDKMFETLQAEAEDALQSIDEQSGQMRAATVSNLLAMQVMRAAQTDEEGIQERAIESIDRLTQALRTQAEADKSAIATQFYFQAAITKGRLLQQIGRQEEAEAALEELVAQARQLPDEAAPNETAGGSKTLVVVQALANLSQVVDDAERRAELFTEARDMLVEAMEANPSNIQLTSTYMSLVIGQISSLAQNDPEQAEQLIADTRERLEGIQSDDRNLQRMLTTYSRALDNMSARIEAALRLQKLVGSPAPEIDAQYWVHGDKDMAVEDLEGKVVLLDFWAVWCGPCIATFPHLREWQQEFGDKGFQIVGVTQMYGRVWDEETSSAIAPEEGEVTDEEELKMLDQFMTHHELLHPSIVAPEGSDMYEQFAVSGIPHAVLIDRKGVIRMIKVGSGPRNAKDLHEKITELIAE